MILLISTLLIWSGYHADANVALPTLLLLPVLGMFYHRAIQRIQGLQAGSASAWDQFMKMLQLTPSLHHEGDVDIEATHSDNATEDWYTLRVANHNEGKPEEATWCSPNVYNNRTPKSFALIVGKADGTDGTYKSAGDAHFKRDTQTQRYAMGTVRWATATADSVAGSPPTVQATDDEFGCQIQGGIEVSGLGELDPGIKEGDGVAYVIKNDGVPVTFAGGGAGLFETGTAVAKAREGDTQVTVVNDVTGATEVVELANTPAGKTPNINAGATVVYGRARNGNFYCVSDYSDDPVGTVKGWRLPLGANRPAATSTSPSLWINDAGSWNWFSEAGSRNVPNCGDDIPFLTIGQTGGTTSHDHDPHEFTIAAHHLTFTSQTVVSAVSFSSADCSLSGNTTEICVLAGVS